MGNKKEAVSKIMKLLPEWTEMSQGHQLRGVRLDADAEVVGTTADSDMEVGDAVPNHDYWSLGYITGHRLKWPHKESKPEWFVPNDRKGASSLIGHTFNRMEYEIFRAAIIQEQGDDRTGD